MIGENICESGLKTLPVFLQFINTPTVGVSTFGCQNCGPFRIRHIVAVVILDWRIVTNYELMVW